MAHVAGNGGSLMVTTERTTRRPAKKGRVRIPEHSRIFGSHASDLRIRGRSPALAPGARPPLAEERIRIHSGKEYAGFPLMATFAGIRSAF